MTVKDVSLLLQMYIMSEVDPGKASYDEFVKFAEKIVAKNTDQVEADLIGPTMKLFCLSYDSSGILDPSRLFLKLQQQVIRHLETNSLSLSDYAAILRMYSDLQIPQSSLFEDMNELLHSHDILSSMDE